MSVMFPVFTLLKITIAVQKTSNELFLPSQNGKACKRQNFSPFTIRGVSQGSSHFSYSKDKRKKKKKKKNVKKVAGRKRKKIYEFGGAQRKDTKVEKYI